MMLGLFCPKVRPYLCPKFFTIVSVFFIQSEKNRLSKANSWPVFEVGLIHFAPNLGHSCPKVRLTLPPELKSNVEKTTLPIRVQPQIFDEVYYLLGKWRLQMKI